MNTWKLEEAKDRLGEVMRRALAHQPQRLKNGDTAVVVVSAEEYAAMAFARDLIEFIQRSSKSQPHASDLQPDHSAPRDTASP